MKKKINFAKLCCFTILLTACSNWLNVKPYDKMSEEDLLKTESGFMKHLNGIYIDLNDDHLFGKALLVEVPEILGGAYEMGTDTRVWGNYIDLNNNKYNTDYWRGRFSSIWDKAYELIKNCNKLIDNMEGKESLFKGNNYTMIRGEATALRAMLHFEMLRLFGPVYSKYPEKESIPYYTKQGTTIGALLPANKVMENVINDLLSAEKLLEKDPITTDGTMMNSLPTETTAMRYRALRLNYYAVQALLARVYLYAGNNSEAFTYATKVIAAADGGTFPFVEQFDVQGTPDPDAIFSKEVIFALTTSKRGLIYKENFDPVLYPNVVFKMNDKLFSELVYGATGNGSETDYRFIANWIQSSNTALTGKCFHKYEDMSDEEKRASIQNTMVPMLRLGEMYLIAAESQGATLNNGLSYVNKLREHRGNIPQLVTLDRNNLTYEYLRELYGEGQMFYYYKRIFGDVITASKNSKPTVKKASDEIFTLPMPDSEMNNR